MAVDTFADNYVTTLAGGGVSGGATSFTPASTTGHPIADPTAGPVSQFRCLVENEVVTVTDARTTPWTCSAFAAAHAAGVSVTAIVSATALSQFIQTGSQALGNASLIALLKETHPFTITTDTPTVATGASATLTAQIIGVQTGQVTEVGSRGTWNATFGRLDVSSAAKPGLDFYLTGTHVEFHVFPGFTGTCPYWIFVDGLPVATAPATVSVTSSTDIYIKLTFGASARRRIEFFMPHAGSWYEVRTDLGSVIEPSARRPCIAWIGDSYFGGSTPTPALQCADFLASRLLGVECMSISFGGTGYSTAGSFTTYGDSTRVAKAVAANPDLIVFFGTVNDDGAGSITTNAAACFAAYKTALPKVKQIVIGPPANDATSTLSANRISNIAAVKTAALAAANVIAFHDIVGNAAGAPAAFATFQTYPDGTLLSSLGSVWKVMNGGSSYAGGPLTPNQAGQFGLLTWVLFGTGKVGTTTSDGNRDTLLYSDGVHWTIDAHTALAQLIVRTILNDLDSYVTA